MGKYFVHIIDEHGLFVCDNFVDSLTDENGDPIPTYIETPCPDGFYWPRWDGEKWVEGGTAPESPPPSEPTLDERNRADIDYIALIKGVAL